MEQWFGILKRQRLRIVDFASKADLQKRIELFIAQWNERAHPFEVEHIEPKSKGGSSRVCNLC